MLKKKKLKITYWRSFPTLREMNSHLTRAKWYIPQLNGIDLHVVLKAKFKFQKAQHLEDQSDLYCNDFAENSEHIKIINSFVAYLREFIRSEIILVHKEMTFIDKLIFRLIKKKVINITTHDINVKEYGEYAGIIWRHILPKIKKEELINNSQKKILKLYKKFQYNNAIVVCTGPSSDNIESYDTKNDLVIICNSIVKNSTLISKLNPKFITAGDVVSHFGVSNYAGTFRKDLEKALLANPDLHLVTTATFGILFYLHYPHLKNQVILIEQNRAGTDSLVKNFKIPVLDSTLNIHMLPLAYTFAQNNIFIIGCDGKSSDQSKNEDFWQHSKLNQYHDIVHTGHEVHPTFDKHRQVSTYDRYIESCKISIDKIHSLKKKVYLLCKSTVPTLSVLETLNPEQFIKKHKSD